MNLDQVKRTIAEHKRPSFDRHTVEGLVQEIDRLAAPKSAQASEPFQQRVQPWMMACFGAEISANKIERNHRFLEEAVELVQSTGCTVSEAHQLVDYVYGRPVGETHQEIGGVMVTLAALCLALGDDMHTAGETELTRVWTKVDKIRAKQAAKPKHSPLPETATSAGDVPLPLDDWHEDFGDAVWWTLKENGQWLGEPAYIGSPLDLGKTVLVTVDGQEMTCTVGGWPGYHTHWTPHPDFPQLPTPFSGGSHG